MQQFRLNSTGHRIPVKVTQQRAAAAYEAAQPLPIKPVTAAPAQTEPEASQPPPRPGAQPDWEAVARQMQADMENFRKRQQRRADEAIAAEKERLLRQFLPLADNLNRALSQNTGNVEALRAGIELTLRQLAQTLAAEGVTRIEAVGHPFDPAWHEAVATVAAGSAPNMVVEEVEAGYKINQKLLRPAKLIVAE